LLVDFSARTGRCMNVANEKDMSFACACECLQMHLALCV
jgi:hypothetical protein